MINDGGTGAELWFLLFMLQQELSLGHTGLDVLHVGYRQGTVIGTGEGRKEGCDGTITITSLRAKMRENNCSIEVQVRSCVSVEDEVIGSNKEHSPSLKGEALGEVVKEEEMHVGGDLGDRH